MEGWTTEERRDEARGTRVVKNRDIQALADVLPVMQLVARAEEMTEWQRERMTNITQHLTGMPGGGGLPKGLDSQLVALEEAEDRWKQKLRDYTRALRRAERILNGIENLQMRAFVVMKYVMDVPDVEIRRELNLSEWAFSRARKAVEEAETMRDVVWRERYLV